MCGDQVVALQRGMECLAQPCAASSRGGGALTWALNNTRSRSRPINSRFFPSLVFSLEIVLAVQLSDVRNDAFTHATPESSEVSTDLV